MELVGQEAGARSQCGAQRPGRSHWSDRHDDDRAEGNQGEGRPAGYQGPQFADGVAKHLPQLAVEIAEQAKGFEVLPDALGGRAHSGMARSLP
jgi:hypothetical protein